MRTMRQATNRLAAALGSIALAAVLLAPASVAAPRAKHKKAFTLNLCSVTGAVAGAGVTEPCSKDKTTDTGRRSLPQGNWSHTLIYRAHWGKLSSTAHPTHSAVIVVSHLSGSAKVLEVAKEKYRLKVLGNGKPVPIGGGGTASVIVEPSACVAPPDEQCGDGIFLAVKGQWFIQVFVDSYTPIIPGSSEATVEEQDAALKNLEEEMIPRVDAVGKAVAGKV
jgi:hypothetical protein